MKKSTCLILLTFILIASCTDREEEKAIKDFVQTVGKSKLNLDMQIIEINQIGNIIADDSVQFIDSVLQSIARETRFKYALDKYQAEMEISGKELQQKYESFYILW